MNERVERESEKKRVELLSVQVVWERKRVRVYVLYMPVAILYVAPIQPLHTWISELVEGLWNFDLVSQEINYDSPRGGVSVITEKGEITTSYLLVQRAQPTDSGHYTCHPSNANTETVLVHILNGKGSKSLELFHTYYTYFRILFVFHPPTFCRVLFNLLSAAGALVQGVAIPFVSLLPLISCL